MDIVIVKSYNGETSTGDINIKYDMQQGKDRTDEIRQLVQDNKISPQSASRMIKNVQQNNLVRLVKNNNITVQGALAIYNKATDDEKQAIKPALMGKFRLYRGTPEEKMKVREKIMEAMQ